MMHGCTTLPTRGRRLLHARAGLGQPPARPQRPPSPGEGPRGRQGAGRGRKEVSGKPWSRAVDELQVLWRRVVPHKVHLDPASGATSAPVPPGSLGKQVRLRSNHYALTTVLPGARLHSVNITPTAGAAKQAPEGGVPLDVRAAVMGALATRADWDNQRWRFDPASCRLYTRDNLAAGEHDVTLAANAGNSSFKVVISDGRKVPRANVLELLSLLVQASVADAMPQDAIEAGRGWLLRAVQAAGPAGSSTGTGSGRGGGSGSAGGGQGRGRGGGGGRSGRGGRSSSGQRGGRSLPDAGSSGGGLKFWEGLRAAVKSAVAGPSVQLDAVFGAVLPAGSLEDLLCAAADIQTPADLTTDKRKLAIAQAAIKGAKVYVSYGPGQPAQSRVVRALDVRPPTKYRFRPVGGGNETNVAAYWAATHPQLKLKHAGDWPCVMISKTAAIPLELVSVKVPQERRALTERQQAGLIRLAALQPAARLAVLRHAVKNTLREWRLALLDAWSIRVSAEELVVPGRILPDAMLQFGNHTIVEPGNAGQWGAPKPPTWLHPPQLHTWAVLDLGGTQVTQLKDLVDALCRELKSAGGLAVTPRIVSGDVRDVAGGVERCAADAGGGDSAGRGAQLQLLLVVLPRRDPARAWRDVKAAGTALGIVTQCVRAERLGADSGGRLAQLAANLALGLGAKTGGVPWALPVQAKPREGPHLWAPTLQAPVMVLGIDVTHAPGSGARRAPSVAALVASLDDGGARYAAAALEQTAGHEIVLGVKPAVEALLNEWRAANAGSDPGSVLVFRDGISEGAYPSALTVEVEGLRAALPPGTRVTYFVASRAHGTRLLPHEADPASNDASVGGRSGNVPPGTVVDDDMLTRPSYYDFFLNSHAGILGTNRCTLYTVLCDDSDAGPDALQLLTQHLASVYAGCNRTLSVPAVLRYADKAAAVAACSGGAGPWTTVVPGLSGEPDQCFRMLPITTTLAGRVWFV